MIILRFNSSVLFTTIAILIASLTFLLIGIDKVNKAIDPALEDTGSYLEGALSIKESGGISQFVGRVLSGQYKIVVQHPLYLLSLVPFASRELSFFPKARFVSLAIGLMVLVALFFIARNLFGETVALMAAVLMVLNVAFLWESSHVACEALLILLFLLSWHFILKGFDSNKHWIWAGALSGLAYLTKGSGLLLIPIFVIALLLTIGIAALRTKYFWVFLVCFFVSSSPLIIRNIVVYQNPLYENGNANVPWLDSYTELSDPKYELLVDWPEHTYRAVHLPTMHSYIQTHSASDIVKRTARGVRGESKLILDSMSLLIGRDMYLNVFVLFFAIVGLARDRDRRRVLLTITTFGVIFLPFSWSFQIIPEIRFITPLIPFAAIYSAFGCIECAKYVDKRLSAKQDWLKMVSAVPYILVMLLVIISAYCIRTKEVLPSLQPTALSDDQSELFAWLRDNVSRDDVLFFGPTQHYWGLLWYAGFKGKLLPTPGNSLTQENLASFEAFLQKMKVSLVIVHRENYSRIGALSGHFEYSDIDGMLEQKPIDGWRLIGRYSRKPTAFLVYERDRDKNVKTSPLHS